MLGVLSAAPADNAQYERSSSNVYDAARVVTPKEFDTPRLLTLFREFAVAHCGRQKLARLTLAANRKDLINATNVNLPEGNLKGIPGLLRAEPSLLRHIDWTASRCPTSVLRRRSDGHRPSQQRCRAISDFGGP